MKFNSDEIASVIQKEIENYAAQIDVREVGRVLEVGDGIAQVYWALHDRDTAVQWLQKAYAARVPAMAFVLVDPLWIGVNDDRRVKALAAGVSAGRVEGAPEY